MINEMNQFEQVLLKYKVDIRRPETINNYNQIFSRDIAFVVDDSFIISNILPDRSNEILAINKGIDLIPKNKIIELHNKNITDDDQNILLQIYFDNPKLFDIKYSNNWFSLFRENFNNM